MKREDTTLYFYPARIKSGIVILFGFIIITLGLLVLYATLQNGDILASFIAVLITAFFGFLCFTRLKEILSPKPYIILTNETLLISPGSKHAVPVEWHDITSFNIRYVNFIKFIGVSLIDRNKYHDRMTKTLRRAHRFNGQKNKELFAIQWLNVKRKDKRKLVYELDRLSGNVSNLTDRFFPSDQIKTRRKKAKHTRVNSRYMLRSYGYSLMLTGLVTLMFYWSDGLQKNVIPLLIVCFMLFPFAKLIFDLIIGFKMADYMERETVLYYVNRLKIIIDLGLYFFSIVIAPFGVLYLMYRYIKQKIKSST